MSTETGTETLSTARCADCQARLAHDQRYCLECGARRGPLPAQVAQLIGSIREQGPAAASEPIRALDTRRPRAEFAMPGPRAAAAAVMGMLGFGVIVGSLAGGASVETLASAPLIVVGLAHTTPAARIVQAPLGARVTDRARRPHRRARRRRRRSPLRRRCRPVGRRRRRHGHVARRLG